jgi:hypothetical protein
MCSPSTSVDLNHPSSNSFPVWCAGCRTIQPIALFLDTVDPACYSVRRQCRRCVNKSQKHWRERREHIKAARIARERECERLTCVCGIQINARYRDKHCQSKRHQSIVALIRQHNALTPHHASSASPPAAPPPAAVPIADGLDDLDQKIQAYERQLSLQRTSVSPRAANSISSSPAALPTPHDLHELYLKVQARNRRQSLAMARTSVHDMSTLDASTTTPFTAHDSAIEDQLG